MQTKIQKLVEKRGTIVFKSLLLNTYRIYDCLNTVLEMLCHYFLRIYITPASVSLHMLLPVVYVRIYVCICEDVLTCASLSPSGFSVQWVPGGTQHKFYITVTVLVVVWVALVFGINCTSNVGRKLEAQPSTITAVLRV